MYIGFLDSGIGGLTVLREAIKVLPEENFIYYADTLHAPYGIKSKEEVKKHVFNAVEFLAGKKIKMLVVACNTATSIAINEIRAAYPFPVVGMEPAVKPAVEKNGTTKKRVLVVATPLTLKEEKFQNLVQRVDSMHLVDTLPMPELVEFAEKFIFHEDTIIKYIKEKFSKINFDNVGTLVLGCTHFPLFRECFKKVIPSHVDIIDGGEGTVRRMVNILKTNTFEDNQNKIEKLTFITKKGGNISFYVSGKKLTDADTLKKYLGLIER